MNNYEAPNANVESAVVDFKPVRGVIYSMLIAIVGVSIFSLMASIVAIVVSGVSFIDEEAVDAVLSQNVLFMVVDAIGSMVLLVLAGRVLAKYVPEKETSFSLIVTVLVLCVYGSTFVYVEGAFSSFPIWYNVASILSLFVGIPIGARLGSKA